MEMTNRKNKIAEQVKMVAEAQMLLNQLLLEDCREMKTIAEAHALLDARRQELHQLLHQAKAGKPVVDH